MNINEITTEELHELANLELRWWNDSSGLIELVIKLADARAGFHSGQCDSDIKELLKIPYIKKQLDFLDEKQIIATLMEYFSDDEPEEFDNMEKNYSRLLWIACGDIVEEQARAEG